MWTPLQCVKNIQWLRGRPSWLNAICLPHPLHFPLGYLLPFMGCLGISLALIYFSHGFFRAVLPSPLSVFCTRADGQSRSAF